MGLRVLSKCSIMELKSQCPIYDLFNISVSLLLYCTYIIYVCVGTYMSQMHSDNFLTMTLSLQAKPSAEIGMQGSSLLLQ